MNFHAKNQGHFSTHICVKYQGKAEKSFSIDDMTDIQRLTIEQNSIRRT
jgi:hypothetical protein